MSTQQGWSVDNYWSYTNKQPDQESCPCPTNMRCHAKVGDLCVLVHRHHHRGERLPLPPVLHFWKRDPGRMSHTTCVSSKIVVANDKEQLDYDGGGTGGRGQYRIGSSADDCASPCKMLPESAVEYLGEIEAPALHVPQPLQ